MSNCVGLAVFAWRSLLCPQLLRSIVIFNYNKQFLTSSLQFYYQDLLMHRNSSPSGSPAQSWGGFSSEVTYKTGPEYSGLPTEKKKNDIRGDYKPIKSGVSV
jgi:hypothetical protein